MKKLPGLRPAVAMLELIFAIAVMGIALLAVPNILTTSAKSGFVGLQQESISQASAHIGSVMTYHWDEADANESFIDPVLRVSNGDSELDNSGNGYRTGTPVESYRRFIRADGAILDASSTLGSESGDRDDVDDFNGETTTLRLVEAATNDYIDSNITIATSVTYNDDSSSYDSANTISFTPFTAKSATTNIKENKITLTTNSSVEELNKTIVLRAFSCNIGGFVLEKRIF